MTGGPRTKKNKDFTMYVGSSGRPQTQDTEGLDLGGGCHEPRALTHSLKGLSPSLLISGRGPWRNFVLAALLRLLVTVTRFPASPVTRGRREKIRR